MIQTRRTRFSLRRFILCALALCAFAASVTAAPVDFGRDVRPFLEQHCVSCHGPKKKKGGVRVDTMAPIAQSPEFANTWLEVREQILSGEMPPEDPKQPAAAEKQAVIAWIDAEVERARRDWASTGGKVVLRRLNRNEYAESVRHLLHLHPAIDTAANFPDDDSFHGFDNIGTALNISPVQMRAYVENATRVLRVAFPEGKAPKPEITRITAMDAVEYYRASERVGEWKRETNGKVIPKAELKRQEQEVMAAVPRVDGTRTIRFGVVGRREYLPDGVIFPNQAQVEWGRRPAGVYKFRFHGRGVPNEKGDLPMLAVSLTSSPPVPDAPVQTTDLAADFRTYEMTAYAQPDLRSLRFEVAAMGNRFFYQRGVQMPRVQVQWVEIEGPLVENWPGPAWQAYFSGAEEAGVRFIELNMEYWDTHNQHRRDTEALCWAVDQPIAALFDDLKRRGLWDDTLIVWGGEFGRTLSEKDTKDGTDHNPRGYTMFLAGGAVKGGCTHGQCALDDQGTFASEGKVHVHDLHATILHLLGLDHERLTYRYAGRDFRLTDVFGNVVPEIIA